MKIKKIIAYTGLLFLGACATSGRNKGDINIYSQAQDAKLGAQWADQVQKTMPMLFDERLVDYVNGLGQKMTSKIEDRVYDFHFKVVKDPQVNAFALPGGFIYVNLGLLQAVEDEAELAMVLGHESGHVMMRHGTEQLTKAQGFSCCLGIGAQALGLGKMEVEVINLFGQTGLLYYGRKAELEADTFGVETMYKAHYDLNYASAFFKKLLKIEKGKPSLMEKMLSTHPPTKDRIKHAEAEAKKYTQAAGATVTTPAFKEMKQLLEKYPNKFKEKEIKSQYLQYLASHSACLHD